MSASSIGNEKDAELRAALARWHQEDVLHWWPELTPPQQHHLRQQLQALDLELLQRLFHQEDAAATLPPVDAVRPAPVTRLGTALAEQQRDRQAALRGAQALRAGQVAVVLVAGGQGTRLGYDGPKGTYAIGPVSGKSLFQIHAEKVLALGRRHGTPLPLYVMTSPDNDTATRAFFVEHAFFGLAPEQVVFFQQGTMPALDVQTGKLLLAGKDSLATSPNGHGGVLQALADGGRLDELERRGVRHLFYYQVDNPMVKVADPTYLGHHIEADAEMSLKVVPKLDAAEKVGVVVEVDGRLQLIEYSDLQQLEGLAERRTADGSLFIWAGSIAVHIFDVSFLRRLAVNGALLPFHRAVKKVPSLDREGQLVKPAEANAVKFEMFVFDALPLARQPLVVETSRREEFEPLKNADGDNSPATVRQAMSDLFAGWLRAAGVEVPRRPDGAAAVAVEIGPLLALDAEEFKARNLRLEPVTGPLLLDTPPER